MRVVATLARASDRPLSAWNVAAARMMVYPTNHDDEPNWEIQTGGSLDMAAAVRTAAEVVRGFFPRVKP